MKDPNNIYNFSINEINEIEKRSILTNFLNEDIGTGDITSNILIPEDFKVHATIICKNDHDSIVSGLKEIETVFDICDCNCSMLVEDGSIVRNGMQVMNIEGSARSILKAERTALNLLMRMSGISTITHQFVKRLKEFSDTVRIASTRKTAPGLRYFDKKAVVMGGGISHRTRLDQLILIKDNHIAIVGSVKKAVQMAKSNYKHSIKIECEVNNYNDIIDAIQSGADIVMLDNFTPTNVYSCMEMVKNLGIREKAIIEVSGGINLDNVYDYAIARPDVISIGSLTHSFKSIDYSLDII